MRRLIIAITAAALLLATTAGTALMATPTVGASCGADNGLVTVSFIYDASQNPPPITTVQVVNNDQQAVTVGATFINPSDFSVLWDGSAKFNPGTRNINVAPLGYTMIQFNGKFGTTWAFPVIVSCNG